MGPELFFGLNLFLTPNFALVRIVVEPVAFWIGSFLVKKVLNYYSS